MGWQITWKNRTYTDTDLTVGHMALICGLQEVDDWAFINPLGGPVKLLGVLAALVATAERRPLGEVVAEVSRARAVDLLNAISTTDDEPDE